MKKQFSCLLLVVVLLLFLVACKGMNNKWDTPLDSAPKSSEPVSGDNILFAYSQALGDEAVAYSLGRSFNYDYSLPFYAITPYSDDGTLITLDPSATSAIDMMLHRVAGMAALLPRTNADPSTPSTAPSVDPEGGPVDGSGEHGEPDEAGTDDLNNDVDYGDDDGGARIPAEGLSFSGGGFSVQALAYNGLAYSIETLASITKKYTLTDTNLMEVFFPDGFAPDVAIIERTGVIAQNFRAWFLNVSQDAGLLDCRLFNSPDGDWCVYAMMCSQSNGGAEFRVFENVYTLSVEEIGDLSEFVATAPKYNMIRESFIYFDNGDYTATYVTDPGAGSSSTARVTVSFSYNAPTEVPNDDSTALERYLQGVYNLTVALS